MKPFQLLDIKMKQQPRPISHLRKGIYYTITNCSNGLALSMPKTNKFIKDKPELQTLNRNNINQLWMIQQITPNLYEIVHAYSTLVLQSISNTTICKLEFGKQKYTQLFYLEQDFDLDRAKANRVKQEGITYQPPSTAVKKQEMNQARLEKQQELEKKQPIRNSKLRFSTFKAGQRFVARLRIKQRQHSKKYLYCDKVNKTIPSVPYHQQTKIDPRLQPHAHEKLSPQAKTSTLKFMEIDIFSERDSTLWEICQVKTEQNQMLAQTCFISSFRSSDVLDVPEASDKQGTQIIQYACNFRFNQRWILKKVDEVNGYGFYMIMNAKTGLYLDIKGEILKQGTPIIQWENHQGKNQIWRFEEQGRRTYLIRSALDKDLLLGVKQNSIKQCAEIVTSKIETQSFWTIYGFIPQ